jgi:hypothetical protein
MTIEELAKEYANRHLDVSEELGTYLVKAVFLDGAEYQREKQDEFAIGFAEWIRKETYYEHLTKEFIYKRNVYASEKELLEIYKKEKGL